ncbi:mycofactocin-coupled SDR family oxidoreductase [Saccharopolyspora sp. HNM0986]|uniref:mycofactocin-coupled SDR family oxidoreductase n=1 Tax=Saccharopolyspora galaxeae TaxID=2781241 RepID=UPI00190AE60B|nr:mycofactocin-coupled SDR family oxidoreductase [Saccharopolyspora sp. HNM0986]MBK0868849.1 mycofactocin-coupled SDR family oxidoreductase [Saccharopolyspora sp. HNM0986]
MGALTGKIALVTGSARGQGRSHATRLAEAGADVIAVDRCETVPEMPYAMPDPDDLAETARLVQNHDRRIVTAQVDVRDGDDLASVVAKGAAELGGLDIVVVNAGISTVLAAEGTSDSQTWNTIVATNMTGVWNTVEAALPPLRETGRGGSIIMTGSTASLKGLVGAPGTPAVLAYTAAKHGVVGLMKSYAVGLAKESIRVNTVHPSGVDTPMLENDSLREYFAEHPADAEMLRNALPVKMLQPGDISDAVLWLASDASRYVTGVGLPVDAGFHVL